MKSQLSGACLALLAVLATAACSSSKDTAQTNFLTVDEDRIHFETAGEGFPLVLVSGGSGMDSRQWQLVSSALAESYRVIKFDPRGVGQSDNPTARYSDTADLDRLLDHLQLDRAIVVGVSSAGGFALEFALEYPDRVAGVVAAAPFVPGFEFSESMMARINRFSQAAREGREPFLDAMLDDPHFIPAPLDRSVRVAVRQYMGEQFDKGADFDPGLPTSLSPPLIEQLPDISSPVLLLAGALDHPEVFRRNAFLLTQIHSAEEKTIDQAGHNAPLENPDVFLDSIELFLSGIARQ